MVIGTKVMQLNAGSFELEIKKSIYEELIINLKILGW